MPTFVSIVTLFPFFALSVSTNLTIADTTLCALAGVNATDDWAASSGLPPVDGVDLSEVFLAPDKATLSASPRSEVPLQALSGADLNALAEWESHSRPHPATPPTCYSVDQCQIVGVDAFVARQGVGQDECCTLCAAANGTGGPTCAVGVYFAEKKKDNQVGSCSLFSAAALSGRAVFTNKTAKSVCSLPSAISPPPQPVLVSQAGIVVGDLKLITGTEINMYVLRNALGFARFGPRD